MISIKVEQGVRFDFLILLPRRSNRADAVVHLVNSATAPLGGDDLDLTVRVRAGATLRLSGVAATLAAAPQALTITNPKDTRLVVESGGRSLSLTIHVSNGVSGWMVVNPDGSIKELHPPS